MPRQQRRRDRIIGNIHSASTRSSRNNQAGGARQPTRRINADAASSCAGVATQTQGQHGRNGGVVYAMGEVFFNVHDTVNNTPTQNGAARFRLTKITLQQRRRDELQRGAKRGAAFFAVHSVLLLEMVSGFLSRTMPIMNGGVAFAKCRNRADSLCLKHRDVRRAIAVTTILIFQIPRHDNTADSAGGQ